MINRGAEVGFLRPEYSHDWTDKERIDPCLVADVSLMTRIQAKLWDKYRGHQFAIQVSHAQGVVMISMPLFTGATRQWVGHISDLANDPGLKIPVRLAGEILERVGMPTCNFNLDDFQAALSWVPPQRRATSGFLRHG